MRLFIGKNKKYRRDQIDSSKLKYFKESNAKPYLDIIVDIINKKL
jgi:hypothetical protein